MLKQITLARALYVLAVACLVAVPFVIHSPMACGLVVMAFGLFMAGLDAEF